MQKSALALGIWTAASSLVAPAGAQETDAFALGQLVVAAKARDGAALGGATVSAEAMRTLGRGSVDQALALIPGVAASATGGSRNERLVFLRGFDRGQLTLSIDGVRVFLPADNRIDFGRFLTADLAEIQISKGYASVLDGPGALGGGINLVTRRPREPREADVVVGAGFDGDGTPNGAQLSGRVGAAGEVFYAQASAAYAERDHFALADGFRATPLENGGFRDRSETEDWRANLKVGITPSATSEHAISYIRQSGSKNAPYHVTDAVSTRYWDWPSWDIESLYALSTAELGPVKVRSRIYLNGFENTLFAYDDPAQSRQSLPRAFRSYYEDRSYGASVNAEAPLGRAWTFRGALHLRRDRHKERQDGFVRVQPIGAPARNEPFAEPWQTNEEDTYAAALETQWTPLEPLDLVLGLSHEWTDLRRAEDESVFAEGAVVRLRSVSFPLKDQQAWNAQAALGYRLAPAMRVHASISSRARFPTLFERFSTRLGAAVPNPDISPERAINSEIGIDMEPRPGLRFEGAVFHSDLSDALIQIPVALGGVFGTVNQTRNVAEGRYYGVEASFQAEPTAHLSVSGHYTFTERDLEDPTNPAFRPLGVPRQQAFLQAEWRVTNRLSLIPSLELASDRFTVTSSAAIAPPRFYKIGAYALLNLAAALRLSESADLLLGARNLRDQTYALVDGFPEEGRSLYASLRIRT